VDVADKTVKEDVEIFVFGFKVNLKAVFSSEISRAMGTTM
jgi:hypothetical protein